jgi:putative transposase
MRRLATERPRFGYRRLYVLLRREGLTVNHKRIYRLYRNEGLTVCVKRIRRLAAAPRLSPPRPTKSGQRWSMDFVTDRTSDGHRFRVLTLVDDFSRRCPGLVVERSIGGRRVVRFLDEIATKHGYPQTIVIDNGPEFISNVLDQWAHNHGVHLHFIRPGRPVENAFIESFNGRFRDECLNTNWFDGLECARNVIYEWLEDYNERSPPQLARWSQTSRIRKEARKDILTGLKMGGTSISASLVSWIGAGGSLTSAAFICRRPQTEALPVQEFIAKLPFGIPVGYSRNSSKTCGILRLPVTVCHAFAPIWSF